MNDDNLGNFYDAESFSNESGNDNDSWKPVKIYGNQLFKKGIDILNLSQTICDVLPIDEHAEVTRSLMLENAMTVITKIKGAMAVDNVYSIVMESAVIIKVNICQLKDQLWACEALHEVEQKYVDVLRDELEEFKLIFIQWLGSFNKDSDLPDEWYLFNNPADFPDGDETLDDVAFGEDDED